MAIQVSGTSVIDNSRNLQNIGSGEFSGRLSIRDVEEFVNTSSSTSGTINFNLDDAAVLRLTNNQAANRTLNLQVTMDVGDSVTCAVIWPNGGSAYYASTIQVNGTTSGVDIKWVGGGPTEGIASSWEVYSFTIFETSANNYTLLASKTAFE